MEKARVIHVPRDREMAAKVKHIDSLREKKKRDAANTQALIDEELDDLNALADVVLNAEQVDLPFEEEATAALAKIAATCSPVEALACPVHGDCTCVQPEPVVLVCLACKGPATCMGIGTPEETFPACDSCCKHDQDFGKCRPVTPEDQPYPPTMAPAVKAVDCPLHGVDSKHGLQVGPVEEQEAPEADAHYAAPEDETPEDKAAIEDA